jgi:hypothetical protein
MATALMLKNTLYRLATMAAAVVGAVVVAVEATQPLDL